MEFSMLYFPAENSDRPHPSPRPPIAANWHTVCIRSTYISSICGFADTGLLAKKSAPILKWAFPSSSELETQTVLYGLWAFWFSNEKSTLTAIQVEASTAFLTLLRENLKFFTSVLSWALHLSGTYVTMTVDLITDHC